MTPREQQKHMEQKTNNKSAYGRGDSGDNKVLTLIDVFFIKTKSKSTLRNKIVRNIASFALVPATFRLLLTCKEMLVAEEKIFQGLQLPTICDMRRGDGLKMYHLMVSTPNSRWLIWLATSKVKSLLLPRSVTDEEMLIMFGGVGRFSELQTLNLSCCRNITDASLTRVARGWSNLHSLNLAGCSRITDASLTRVARGCPNLQSLNLDSCRNITDASLGEVAFGCLNLQSLVLRYCSRITDASLTRVARGCSNLQSLNLYECNNITGASLAAVGVLCSYLQSLDLRQCFSITSVDKNVLRKLHPKLTIRDD